MKYAFLNIKIICGEYHFNSMSVHELLPDDYDFEIFAKEYASDFYGSPDEVDPTSNYFDFNGGEVSCKVQEVREITEEEYNVLSKFL